MKLALFSVSLNCTLAGIIDGKHTAHSLDIDIKKVCSNEINYKKRIKINRHGINHFFSKR